MPNDIARFMNFAPRLDAFRGDRAVPLPANSNPSVRELLSRNGALAVQNRQLTMALARLTEEATTMLSRLTPRQREVMAMVLDGHPSKNIAADLNISQRTVENHRAAIMRRTGASSLPELVRLSLGVS
jgi:two-component system CheB/CheR fusion protein